MCESIKLASKADIQVPKSANAPPVARRVQVKAMYTGCTRLGLQNFKSLNANSSRLSIAPTAVLGGHTPSVC